MLLQPLKLLRTSCISTCIGFKNERKIRENSVKFGGKIGLGEFNKSSGGGTGIVD